MELFELLFVLCSPYLPKFLVLWCVYSLNYTKMTLFLFWCKCYLLYINNVCNGTIWYIAHGIDLFYWFVLVACKLIISWQLASCLAQCMQWCTLILGQARAAAAGWLVMELGRYYLNILLLQLVCLAAFLLDATVVYSYNLWNHHLYHHGHHFWSNNARDREKTTLLAGIILQQTSLFIHHYFI